MMSVFIVLSPVACLYSPVPKDSDDKIASVVRSLCEEIKGVACGLISAASLMYCGQAATGSMMRMVGVLFAIGTGELRSGQEV